MNPMSKRKDEFSPLIIPVKIVNCYRQAALLAEQGADEEERAKGEKMMEKIQEDYPMVHDIALSKPYLKYLERQGWPKNPISSGRSTTPSEFKYIPTDLLSIKEEEEEEPEPVRPVVEKKKALIRREAAWDTAGDFFLLLLIFLLPIALVILLSAFGI